MFESLMLVIGLATGVGIGLLCGVGIMAGLRLAADSDAEMYADNFDDAGYEAARTPTVYDFTAGERRIF